MLIEIAIGDAYGAGFEYAKPTKTRPNDDSITTPKNMRFKTYAHNYDGRSVAEMLGVENSHSQPCNDVTFDYPERPNMGEVLIEEAE